MIVNRSVAARLLSLLPVAEKVGGAVAVKPFRVCDDCLAGAREHDPKLVSTPLSKKDIEVLKWRCQGRNCYSSARHQVDGDRFTAARKKNTVLEKKGNE